MRVKHILDESVAMSEKEVDYYVPVSIDYKDNDATFYTDSELYYIKWVNHVSSFLMLTINSLTEKIIGVSTPGINERATIAEDVVVRLDVPRVIGNVVIDMDSVYPNKPRTDTTEFTVALGEKSIYILKTLDSVTTRVVMGDMDVVLDSDNNVSGFIFSNFTDYEWNEIIEGIDAGVKRINEPE